VAAPVFTYRRDDYHFGLPPDRLWERIGDVEQFEGWWPWLSEFRLDGDGLSEGSILTGVVTPPLPYRMRIEVELERCDRPRSIDAAVRGDLTGEARLLISPEDTGSRVGMSWTIEMRQPVMRLAARFGRPLLQWGHDRVVETTVASFRRRLDAADS